MAVDLRRYPKVKDIKKMETRDRQALRFVEFVHKYVSPLGWFEGAPPTGKYLGCSANGYRVPRAKIVQ